MLVEGLSPHTVLDEIDNFIDFAVFAEAFDVAQSKPSRGRPSYPPLLMFKILLVQVLYNLSDEKMSEALADRLSFRRFCGFALDESTPDQTTICRFRNSLQGLETNFLDMVNEQLDQHGMRVRKGTLVDASIVKSNSKNPQGGEVSERDPEAGWTKKGGQYQHGYKAHVGMDQESGLINKTKVTSADVHDGKALFECLDGDDEAVFADKAYDNESDRKVLRQHQIKPRLMRRTYKSDSPTRKTRKANLNKAMGKIRGAVEKFFGTMKRSYGMRQARYLGVLKNELHVHLVAVVYNLVRATNIRKDLNLQPT
jgi:IS5 family transposase